MSELPILRIKIDNVQDLELIDFTNSMLSLNNQYHRFLSNQKSSKVHSDCKLYVHQISHGSLIVDLCEKAIPVLIGIPPLLVEYSKFLINVFDYFLGKKEDPPSRYEFAKEDYLNFKKIVEPAARQKGNSINFKGIYLNNTINIQLNHTETNAIQNQCDKEIKKLEENGQILMAEQVTLRLYQARNSILSQSQVGNLGIIDDVCKTPKPLSFADDKLCTDITATEKNPLNYVYYVDANVVLKEGIFSIKDQRDVKRYEILKLHGVIEQEDFLIEDKKNELIQ